MANSERMQKEMHEARGWNSEFVIEREMKNVVYCIESQI